MVKVGDTIEVLIEDLDHPFKIGDKLTVTELLDYGCVWAKDGDKLLGCLMPSEFQKVNKKKKGARK